MHILSHNQVPDHDVVEVLGEVYGYGCDTNNASARDQALKCMEENAELLGADAILSVGYDNVQDVTVPKSWHCMTNGTAVKLRPQGLAQKA